LYLFWDTFSIELYTDLTVAMSGRPAGLWGEDTQAPLRGILNLYLVTIVGGGRGQLSKVLFLIPHFRIARRAIEKFRETRCKWSEA
jgi:hypothetical protein